MQPVPLVETTRGYPASGFCVENVHLGSVAVVDARGKLLWSAGNLDAMVFTRSALKPFQALPFVLDDGPARYGLRSEELALLCASHSGEEPHLQAVQSILNKIGLDETHLACGCHTPLFYDSLGVPVPPGQIWRPVHHNCSGKHSGFLAWCRLHGAPTAAYVDPAHPLQQRIRASLAELTGMPADKMPVGMDGCSAPNYAMPLARLANLYARLAQGSADPVHGAAMGDLFYAMSGHPDYVSGQARADLAYMRAGQGDWVSKIGADAVQTIGIRSAGLGIAIKIADGAKHVLQSATFSVLDQLGVMNSAQRALLDAYRSPSLRNARGAEVGAIRPVFTLQPAA
ncbi:MAG TPA: asparaginase [Telluria sp.]|jgi:L-asparaginase II